MSIWRRLKYLLPSNRRAAERDLQEELESLRAMSTPGELGNLTRAAENARAEWGWGWIDSAAQDLCYGVRTLLRHRRVTAMALLSLGLGIGANTLVFSFLDALLLRPLPYAQPERLVLVGSSPLNNPGQITGLTRGDCATFAKRKEVFERFGCYTDPVSASLGDSNTIGSSPERLRGWQMTAGAADAFGIQPLLGRWFTDADEQQDAGRVLLISASLWQRRFGGRPDVVGTMVRFNGENATIIGVLPENFEFGDQDGDYCTPFQNDGYGIQSPARILGGLARLKPGLELAGAQSIWNEVSVQLAEESPQAHKNWKIVLRPMERLSGDVRNPLLVLQGSVAFVLLIACANVAGLLLAQGTTQHKEVAVRVALGSSRWRIFRQLLMHSMTLSFAGGVMGLLLGLAGMEVLTKTLPAGLPNAAYEVRLNAGVLLFTVGACALSALIVGIAPGLQISHAEPLDAMRESGRSSTAGVHRQRLRSVFVMGQIALALMLLVSAGLMINSLVSLVNEPLGFDPNNLATVAIDLPEGKFRRPTSAVLASGALEMKIDPQIYVTSEEIRKNLAVISGVSSASGIAIYPPFSGAMNMPISIEGNTTAEAQRAQFLPILPAYFNTLQVRILQGREFTAEDRTGNLPVAVINQAMARRFWPNESPLGKHVRVESPTLPGQPSLEIIGIVEEVMQYPGQLSRPQLYIPYLQLPPQHDERLTNDLRHLTFIVRTPRPLTGLMSDIKAALSLADASQAASNIRTMWDTAFNSMQRRRVYAGLIGTFAAIAGLLAVVGVYGVMAQVVSHRTNEIGIRMALGANATRVRSLVIRQGLPLIGVGLVIGALGAVASSRLIRSSLFGVTPTDPLIYTAAAVLLGVAALVACYLPARRASRIDPMAALRHD